MLAWTNWREYQEAVASFFRSLGYSAEVEASIEGVRGKHKVDVYVTFSQHGLAFNWVVECKLWDRPAEKANVVELQGIVSDLGADRGLLFSEAGFQSGAQRMARGSNITLISSLTEFISTASTGGPPLDQRLIETTQFDGGPTVFRFPGPPARPQHLVRYRDSIVVGNWDVGNLSFVNPGQRSIEAVVLLDKYESRLNRMKAREIRVHPPGDLAIADNKLFLGQVFSDNILVVDLATRSVVKRIQVPGGGEGSIAAAPNAQTVYFASNKDNALFSIDTATYELERFPYPSKGRGSMSIACSPDSSRVFVGVQRGYWPSSGDLPEGGCFLAVFEPQRRVFIQSLPLYEHAHGRPDVSTPAYILPDVKGERLYVGMFQGCPGIYILGGDPLTILRCSRPKPNSRNYHFEWVDPLALQFFRDDLLAIHRNNLELVLLDRETLALKRSTFLGQAPNGPRDLLVFGDQAIITYPERGGLLFLDLDAEESWKH